MDYPTPAPPGSLDASQVAALTPLEAQVYFANESIVDDYQPWADRQTQDNAKAFQNAVDTAQQTGQTVAPTSYNVITVDKDLVYALFTNQDVKPEDWNKVFISTPFTPPQPVVPQVPKPVGYPVGALSSSNEYMALDSKDTKYASGDQFTDSRGTFTKHIVVTPFGNSTYWTLNS